VMYVRRVVLYVVISKHRPHRCNTCQKQFFLNDSLKRHLFTYTGERPHTNVMYARRNLLKLSILEHICIHTSNKPNIFHSNNLHVTWPQHLCSYDVVAVYTSVY